MPQTRMTRQRAAIMQILRDLKSHPTADELYGMVKKQLPHISLGTVYRNLDILTRAGEIICLERAGIQKRFDGNTIPHHHVRCRCCGRVGDIFFSPVAPLIQDAQAEDFTIHSMEVEYVGLCRDCEIKEC